MSELLFYSKEHKNYIYLKQEVYDKDLKEKGIVKYIYNDKSVKVMFKNTKKFYFPNDFVNKIELIKN